MVNQTNLFAAVGSIFRGEDMTRCLSSASAPVCAAHKTLASEVSVDAAVPCPGVDALLEKGLDFP
jgi:hypothetical protein